MLLHNALSSMDRVRLDEAHRLLQMHRFAVQLYETLAERYGIHHEQTELALRLVGATNPNGCTVAVSVPSGNSLSEKRSRGLKHRSQDA
jgi:hypothetical protein